MSRWAGLAQRARIATGLTQKDFAAAIGASRASVGAWEAGLRAPSRLTLSLLCLVEHLGPVALEKLDPCHALLDAG